MSTQTGDSSLVDRLIDSASELPPECQEWLLAIAKGMAFAKSCAGKRDDDKTA